MNEDSKSKSTQVMSRTTLSIFSLMLVASGTLAAIVTPLLAGSAAASVVYSKPKVRAITAFVRLEQATYHKQITDTLNILRQIKREFESAGYSVEDLRITTQPLGELVKGLPDEDAFALLQGIDKLAAAETFLPNVGPGMLRDADDPGTMHLLARALSTLPNIEASSIIAADDGIHWKVISETAALVRYVADHSLHSQGNFNFTATAMLQPYGPFYPGSYHSGAGQQFAIGLEAANVVQEVFAQTNFGHANGDPGSTILELTKQLTTHAKVAESIGARMEKETGWKFMGVDPTPAPLGNVSIADAIEKYSSATFGSSGTMTAALIITTAVKAVNVKQVGYAGLMVPVMEDKLLAQRWSENTFTIDSILAYSAVCGTGLDTIPLPGDVSDVQLKSIFGDVASLAWKWKKPLSARLLPVKGARAGEKTEFNDPFLFNTKIRPVP